MKDLEHATSNVVVSDMQCMVLDKSDLPPLFDNFRLGHESILSNETLATQGFPGSDAGNFRRIGRINGYMREYLPQPPSDPQKGDCLMAATVVHLFENQKSVHTWMHDVFIKGFEAQVGQEIRDRQQLMSIEVLHPCGFVDESIGLKAVHKDDNKTVSVTIVDFRFGRLLGVAFVASLGDTDQLEEATILATELEKHFVRFLLK